LAFSVSKVHGHFSHNVVHPSTIQQFSLTAGSAAVTAVAVCHGTGSVCFSSVRWRLPFDFILTTFKEDI